MALRCARRVIYIGRGRPSASAGPPLRSAAVPARCDNERRGGGTFSERGTTSDPVPGSRRVGWRGKVERFGKRSCSAYDFLVLRAGLFSTAGSANREPATGTVRHRKQHLSAGVPHGRRRSNGASIPGRGFVFRAESFFSGALDSIPGPAGNLNVNFRGIVRS